MSIGITSLLSPVSYHRLVGLVDGLEARGMDVEFIDGSWDERMSAMKTGRASATWVCGLLHVELSASDGWTPKALAAPRSAETGQPVYFGRVVAHVDSPIRSFGDLEGSRFAYNEETSLSGYRMMLDRLGSIRAGLDFFSQTIRTGSHVDSLRLVGQGAADCAIIDSIVLEDLDPPGLRVIESVGPYPAPPLVAVPMIEPPLREALDPTTWAAVVESDYDRLRNQGDGGK